MYKEAFFQLEHGISSDKTPRWIPKQMSSDWSFFDCLRSASISLGVHIKLDLKPHAKDSKNQKKIA